MRLTRSAINLTKGQLLADTIQAPTRGTPHPGSPDPLMGAGSSDAAQEHPPAPTHPPEHPPARIGTARHGTCQARLQPCMRGCKGGRGAGQRLGTGRGTPVCPPCSPTAPQTVGVIPWRGGRTEIWGLRGPGRDRGHPSLSPLPGAAAAPAPLL